MLEYIKKFFLREDKERKNFLKIKDELLDLSPKDWKVVVTCGTGFEYLEYIAYSMNSDDKKVLLERLNDYDLVARIMSSQGMIIDLKDPEERSTDNKDENYLLKIEEGQRYFSYIGEEVRVLYHAIEHKLLSKEREGSLSLYEDGKLSISEDGKLSIPEE